MLVQAMPHHEPLKRFPAKEQESDKAGVLLHLKKMDVDRYIFLAGNMEADFQQNMG
jgi:hypothetical protein